MSIARKILQRFIDFNDDIEPDDARIVLADYDDKARALTAALDACDTLRAELAAARAERDDLHAKQQWTHADALSLVAYFEERIEVTTSPGTLQTLRACLANARNIANRSA